jgi:hypothetical protein
MSVVGVEPSADFPDHHGFATTERAGGEDAVTFGLGPAERETRPSQPEHPLVGSSRGHATRSGITSPKGGFDAGNVPSTASFVPGLSFRSGRSAIPSRLREASDKLSGLLFDSE